MASYTFTQAQLDALYEALVSGVDSIKVDGKEMKWRSKSELLEIIKLVESSLASTSTTNTNLIQATYSKGRKS